MPYGKVSCRTDRRKKISAARTARDRNRRPRSGARAPVRGVVPHQAPRMAAQNRRHSRPRSSTQTAVALAGNSLARSAQGTLDARPFHHSSISSTLVGIQPTLFLVQLPVGPANPSLPTGETVASFRRFRIRGDFLSRIPGAHPKASMMLLGSGGWASRPRKGL